MNESDPRETRVSVVIPSFNHARFIERAIDSALAQTHRDLEVVVIDDGSTDGSPALLRERYGDDPRVVLRARENRGAHATLNEAIGLATGRFVAILNSDDEFTELRIERLLAAARARGPGEFFGFTGLVVVDDGGAPAPESIAAEYYEAVAERMEGEPIEASFWVGNHAITTSNFFFSRSLVDAIGGFAPLRYTHDWDFALRAVARAGVVRIDEPLLLYRSHGANTISEQASWAKLVENAYVFGSLLRRQRLDQLATSAGVSPSDAMRALIKNRSFLPVPALFVASLSWSDADLERALVDGELEAMLRALVERDGFRIELLESAARIDETMEREDHLAQLLWHWRPVRKVRKVLRGVRRDVRANARKLRSKLGSSEEGSE